MTLRSKLSKFRWMFINMCLHMKFHDYITETYLNIFLQSINMTLRSRSSYFIGILCTSSSITAIWSFSTILPPQNEKKKLLHKILPKYISYVWPWGEGHLNLAGCWMYHQHILPYEASVQYSFKNANLTFLSVCDPEVKVI